MKEKVIIFLIGLLLGAFISTGSIYIYTIANNSNKNEINEKGSFMNDGDTPPEMPNENMNNKEGNI